MCCEFSYHICCSNSIEIEKEEKKEQEDTQFLNYRNERRKNKTPIFSFDVNVVARSLLTGDGEEREREREDGEKITTPGWQWMFCLLKK